MKILKIVLNDAVTDGNHNKEPGRGRKSLKGSQCKGSGNLPQSIDGAGAKGLHAADDYYYKFVAFLLCTGMRFGEAAALTWSDIDYKQNVIHVTKTATFNEDNSRTTGTPKSEAGKR